MAPPFVPSGIDHLVIWVGDFEKARAWYQTILGCRPGYDYPDLAMTHVWYGPVLALSDETGLRRAGWFRSFAG